MAAGTLVSVEEYLSTAYRPDLDYVDGVLEERNLGELDHAFLQGFLTVSLYAFRKALGICVLIDQRVQVKPTRLRVPDVCVVLGGKPTEQILTQPPFLCIEILSPEDRMSRMEERISDYLQTGVRYVWVLDPRRRRARIYTASHAWEVEDGVLRTEDPEIAIPLAELFAEL